MSGKLSLYILSVLVFVGILALIIFKNRDEIEVQNYILFIRRTDKGRDLISKISSLNERFWNKLGSLSIIVGFGGMVFVFFFLSNILWGQIRGAPTAGGPALVIPVPAGEGIAVPGVIGVPFWSWIISIGLLMFAHEGMHGVMVKTVKSKIESLGVLLLAVIPGAFVEPDEDDLKQKNWKDQLKVYSSGSFANFCLSLFFILLVAFVVGPLFFRPAVGFTSYVNATAYNMSKYPAQRLNITPPILSINGEDVKSISDLSRIMNKTRPNEEITLTTYVNYTTTKTHRFKLSKPPEGETGFIGIRGIHELNPSMIACTLVPPLGGMKGCYVPKEMHRTGTVIFLREIIGWIILLNLGIGLMNLLPLKPLDGGLMVETLAERFYPEKSEKIVRTVSSISLFVLLSVFLMIFLG